MQEVKLKVGDRVRVYGGCYELSRPTAHRFLSGCNGTVDAVDFEHEVTVRLDNHYVQGKLAALSGESVLVHARQCRRLKPKTRKARPGEVWVCTKWSEPVLTEVGCEVCAFCVLHVPADEVRK